MFIEKEYYPLGIFSSETKDIVIKTQYRLKMMVDLDVNGSKAKDDESMSTAYEVTLTQSKGIYWFGLIQPHVSGILHVQAIVENDHNVIPLNVSIVVTSGADNEDDTVDKYKPEDEVVFSPSKSKRHSRVKDDSAIPNEVSSSKLKGGEISRRKSESTSSKVTEVNVSIESKKRKRSLSTAPEIETVTKKAARESRASREDLRTTISVDEESSEEEIPFKSRQNKKRRVALPLVDEKYRTLPFPPLNFLPASARIQRPISDLITIKGPQLTVTFPPSVSLAFRDDRLRVHTLQMQYPEVTNASLDQQTATQLQYITNNEAFPSVNELLYRLENKVVHVADSSSIIQSMREAFEYYFASNLLYNFEYLVMEDKLLDLESRKVKYGDSFGAPFLLRLIVLIVVGVDTLEVPTSSSGSPRSSSGLRRNAVLEKQTKATYSRLQDILDILLADLEEYAHLLFY